MFCVVQSNTDPRENFSLPSLSHSSLSISPMQANMNGTYALKRNNSSFIFLPELALVERQPQADGGQTNDPKISRHAL
jgi:hypothetical protein